MKDDERAAAPDDPQQKASEQVDVGTGPGRPPASGSGERGQRLSDPPTGRFDEARAAGGTSAGPGATAPANMAVGAGEEPTDGPASVGEPGVDEAVQD